MVFPDHAEYVELVRFTEIPPARFFRGLRIEIIGRASTTTFIQAGAGELLVMLDRSLRASGRGLRAELIPQINSITSLLTRHKI
jgi:ABC-type sulfate transport system substrate-binding protein